MCHEVIRVNGVTYSLIGIQSSGDMNYIVMNSPQHLNEFDWEYLGHTSKTRLDIDTWMANFHQKEKHKQKYNIYKYNCQDVDQMFLNFLFAD